MPLRLQSIQKNQYDTGILSFIGSQDMEKWDAKIQNKENDGNTYFHYTHFMRDVSSGEAVGKLVVTLREVKKRSGLFKKETQREILDIDLTLESETEVEMGFLNKLPGSSGANEYYDVELEGHQRFQVETVNRHGVTGSIEGKTQKVKASAFPFMLTVYDSLDAANEALHVKEILGAKEGLAPDFAAPGSAAIEILGLPGDKNEISSFLFGTVKSVKDVEVKLGGMKLYFALVRMETALGTLPVAMGRSVFNIERIGPGKVVAMLADIKVDFAIDQKPVGIGVPEDYETAQEWIGKKADEIYNMMTQGLDLEKELAATVDIVKADVGSIIEFGTYPQDAQGGTAPIQWQVLAKEEGRILVISKYGLDRKQYNTEKRSVTWEDCTLRRWLNDDFLKMAFSLEEQNRILESTVMADKHPKFDTPPGNDTTDKVFLLSMSEVNNYFASDTDRQCKGTAYCYAKGAYRDPNGHCCWWLRTPGDTDDLVVFANSNGFIVEIGNYVEYGNYAARPALWLNLDS